MWHPSASKSIRVSATFIALIAVILMFVMDSPTFADCKYKFSLTGECAPVQSVSIDRIDFEIVADNREYGDGTVQPSCVGHLYLDGGNVAQIADLGTRVTAVFGVWSHAQGLNRRHEMQASELRGGALQKSEWILEYRGDGLFQSNNSAYDVMGSTYPDRASWWVYFNADHQTIPVSLAFDHDRYGYVNYDAVQVPVPNKLLGFDAALTECRKELLARDDTKLRDFVHRQNIATAQAKIAGAKARKAYYESQMAPLQAQIDELRAIMPSVLAALEDAAKAHQQLLDRKAEYARLMEEFALAESEHYARLFTAVESAQMAIAISVANVEQSRTQIQANIDGINQMIDEINVDIEEASDNLQQAERDLKTLADP